MAATDGPDVCAALPLRFESSVLRTRGRVPRPAPSALHITESKAVCALASALIAGILLVFVHAVGRKPELASRLAHSRTESSLPDRPNGASATSTRRTAARTPRRVTRWWAATAAHPRGRRSRRDRSGVALLVQLARSDRPANESPAAASTPRHISTDRKRPWASSTPTCHRIGLPIPASPRDGGPQDRPEAPRETPQQNRARHHAR